MERTFVMIKPDGVQRRLLGEIISRFERKGLNLVQMRVELASDEIINEHYKELSSKPFFPSLVKYIKSGQVIPMVWEGKNAVAVARALIGATNPMSAERGSIRGDLGMDIGRNVVHGSDSIESAKREINIWFGSNLNNITYCDNKFLYE